MKNIKKKFKLPLYEMFSVTVILCEDVALEVSKLTNSRVDEVFSGVFFAHNERETDLYIILDGKDRGVIVHEVFHLVAYVMRWVGIPLIEESEEAYTYLMTYVFNRVDNIINEK